jgi:vacuolar protein sorting-associated protein 13A/C
MVLFTTSGGVDASTLAIITVDSPKIIFSVDPVFALLKFFRSTEPSSDEVSTPVPVEQPSSEVKSSNPISTVDFRFDLHDVTISVLESDSVAETQAIQLSIKQILLSQQVSVNPYKKPCY